LDLLKRPQLNYAKMEVAIPELGEGIDSAVKEQVEIQAKYKGYIDRQIDEIERNKKQLDQKIPAELDYSTIGGLSAEIIQKLTDTKPETIGQASRIAGITPAAISMLLITIKKRKIKIGKQA